MDQPGLFPFVVPLGPLVCGIDEAGRGPLAGPVYAAAVVLPDDFPLDILDDSKALSEELRESAFRVIRSRSLACAIDWAGPGEIDEWNILGATFLAMERALAGALAQLLGSGLASPTDILIDGNGLPPPLRGRLRDEAGALLSCDPWGLGSLQVEGCLRGARAQAIVRGDALVPAIMAASIAAKVARDHAMERFDWLYPGYGYGRHKGYPTRAHRLVVLERGPSPIQRSSFRVRVGKPDEGSKPG